MGELFGCFSLCLSPCFHSTKMSVIFFLTLSCSSSLFPHLFKVLLRDWKIAQDGGWDMLSRSWNQRGCEMAWCIIKRTLFTLNHPLTTSLSGYSSYTHNMGAKKKTESRYGLFCTSFLSKKWFNKVKHLVRFHTWLIFERCALNK